MDRDICVERVEKLLEKINGLEFSFADAAARQEAESLLTGAATNLESYLDLLENADEHDDSD